MSGRSTRRRSAAAVPRRRTTRTTSNRTRPPTGTQATPPPPPTPAPRDGEVTTVAAMSLENLLDAVGDRVRREMDQYSAAAASQPQPSQAAVQGETKLDRDKAKLDRDKLSA